MLRLSHDPVLIDVVSSLMPPPVLWVRYYYRDTRRQQIEMAKKKQLEAQKKKQQQQNSSSLSPPQMAFSSQRVYHRLSDSDSYKNPTSEHGKVLLKICNAFLEQNKQITALMKNQKALIYEPSKVVSVIMLLHTGFCDVV